MKNDAAELRWLCITSVLVYSRDIVVYLSAPHSVRFLRVHRAVDRSGAINQCITILSGIDSELSF